MALKKEDFLTKIAELGISLEDNVNWDNTKLIKKLGDYTLSKLEKVTWGRKFMQSLETVQLCNHLKDEVKNFEVSPLESDDFVAEFKMNGMRCLHGNSLIMCDDGISRTIKEIVDNKLPVKVLSFNEKTLQTEFKPVIGWYNNGKKTRSNWVIIKGVSNLTKKLKTTKDHKIYTSNRGYVEAKDIKETDEISLQYLGCNPVQKQILLGSFLGDGCVVEEKRSVFVPRYRLNMSHGEKQLPYLTLKNDTLGPLKRVISEYVSGYGSVCYRTVTKPLFDINKYIFNGSKKGKYITEDLLNELDWLGWAIWYLDDGTLCADRSTNPKITNKTARASIALCRYSEEECLTVQKYLSDKYEIESNLNKVKKSLYVLTINTKSSPKFFEKIAKYVPKCMDYKLPLEFRNIEKVEWWKENKCEYNSINVRGFTVHEHYHLDPSIERPWAGLVCYDIEVADNHNFYANGILVHNCITTYDPAEGFNFFSRKESVKNFLNSDFTRKIYLIKDGIVKEPKDYVGKFPLRFVIDGEITVDGDNEFEGQVYNNVEDFLQAVLGSLPQRAKDFQLNGHRLRFTIFDVLYFERDPQEAPEYKFKYEEEELTEDNIKWVETHFENFLISCGHKVKGKKKAIPKLLYKYLITLKDTPKGDIRKLPFYKRREVRKALVSFLNKNGLPFYEVEGEDKDKAGYLDSVLRDGFEGIILKALDAPYISALKSSRSHKACMKVKQSISELMKDSNKFEDFDVFITGANPPKSDRIKDMIGSLSCSIYLTDEFGNSEVHEIANVSGLSHEWKRKLAKVDENGKITLNPEYLDKVIAVDGMALSHASLRFQHAKLKEEDLVFKDKNPVDCVWAKEELEKMIIVRGNK